MMSMLKVTKILPIMNTQTNLKKKENINLL